MLSTQVAGASFDRLWCQDGAIGEDELGGVEPAAEIAVIEVSSAAQTLQRMPESIKVPPRQPGGQQC